MLVVWLKKVVLDIMPSVAATIIGAYIVNYYIVPKARESTAASSASFKAQEAKTPDAKTLDTSATEIKTEPALTEKSVVKAKAASEKASFEKAVAEKTAIEKTAEKANSDRATTDAAAAEPRRGVPSSKSATKSAPTTNGSASADRAPDERRGVNDLARAAIERLRGNSHAESAKADAAKTADKAPEKTGDKTADAPQVQPVVNTVASAPPIQPLPPAINVSTPSSDVFEQGAAKPVMRQPMPQTASRFEDAQRFTPPADIPVSRPIDLRAEASVPDRSSVTDEVMSAARSMFHAVIPR